MAKQQPEPDADDRTLICVMSHTWGENTVIQAGVTMRANEAAPQTHPEYWLPLDSTSGERMRHVVALGGRP